MKRRAPREASNALWTALAAAESRRIESLQDGASRAAGAAEVRAQISRVDLERGGCSLREAIARASQWLGAWGLRAAHPRHFGYPNPSGLRASIAGDALAACFDAQCAAWQSAPGAIEMERASLAALARAARWSIDLGASAFTTGASESLATALAASAVSIEPDVAREGLVALGGRPRVYASREAHKSLLKCARQAGFGARAVVEIDAPAPKYAMDVAALEAAIARDRAEGHRPIAVIATAGTTLAGAIDPIDAIAAVCERHGLWLHLDAAWAGGAALSSRGRSWLAGAERASSIAWDAHKFPGLSLGTGMLFVRAGAALRALFSVQAEYVPEGLEAQPYAASAQWSRRAAGLKVWVSLATEGVDGWAAEFDRRAALGDALREGLRDAGWTIVNDTPLPVLCATREDFARDPRRWVRRACDRAGGAWLDVVTMTDGARALRAAIVSAHTEEADVRALLDALR